MDSVIEALFTQVSSNQDLTTSTFLTRLLVALLAGFAVAYTYMRSHSTLSYSQSFIQALVLLSMVVSLIMMAVGDSLARAFGLGAALAIVRFRTPIKDARDTSFLFLAVAAGMAAGIGMTTMAIAGSILTGATAVFLTWSGFGARHLGEGILRLRRPLDGPGREAIVRVLSSHCSGFEIGGVRSTDEDGEELVYDVRLRSGADGGELVAELRSLGRLEAVSYLPKAHFQEG